MSDLRLDSSILVRFLAASAIQSKSSMWTSFPSNSLSLLVSLCMLLLPAVHSPISPLPPLARSEPHPYWTDFEKLRRLVENLFWRKIEKFFVYKKEKELSVSWFFRTSSAPALFPPAPFMLSISSVLFTFFYYARNKSFICLQRFCVSEQPSIIRRVVRRRLAGRRTGRQSRQSRESSGRVVGAGGEGSGDGGQ